MKQQLITEAQDTLRDLESKKRKAQAKLKLKRGQLIREVQNDTPDLFGERKSNSPDKLFNPSIDPAAIDTALEPIRAEIAGYDREIEKWTKDLQRLVEMPETDLFNQRNVA